MDKFITIGHVEDHSIKVRAKVVKESDSEIEAEYRYGGVTWGVHLPKKQNICDKQNAEDVVKN